jgi:hypothetical protein
VVAGGVGASVDVDPVPDPVGSTSFCQDPDRDRYSGPADPNLDPISGSSTKFKGKLNFFPEFQYAVQINCKIIVGASSNDSKKCGLLYLLFFYGPACSGISRN